MLAKLWKKIALAICIIAILFNITYKLTHKTNIKSELEAVIGTEAIQLFSDDTNTTSTDESEETDEVEEEGNVQSINIEGN